MKVVWSDPALRDVEEIYRYVAVDKPEAAMHLAAKLLESADQLKNFPNLGRPGRSLAEIRELVVGQYLVIYRVCEAVEIVRVMHAARGRRDPKRGV